MKIQFRVYGADVGYTVGLLSTLVSHLESIHKNGVDLIEPVEDSCLLHCTGGSAGKCSTGCPSGFFNDTYSDNPSIEEQEIRHGEDV